MPLPDPNTVITQSSQRSTELTRMYAQLHPLVAEAPARPTYLRPSSFPVCSLTLLDQLLHDYPGETNFLMDFFAGIGTYVHEVIERWAGRTDAILWGNWRCENTECPDYKGMIDGKLVSRNWYHTEDKACPQCKEQGHYQEVTISYLGITGHIDVILITPTGILIGDYKTTTKYGVSKPTFRQHAMMYPLQLCTYAYMMEKVWGPHFMEKYGKRIEGASLLYISRDNPFGHREFNWNREDALAIGKTTARQARVAWNAAQRSLEQKDLAPAMRFKNCATPADYRENVAPFFTYEPCHLSEVCFKKKDREEWFAALPSYETPNAKD